MRRMSVPLVLLATGLVPLGMVTATHDVARGAVAVSPASVNGLALTPPMGWNDWNAFGCSVSASLVQQTADAIVRSGLKAAGYTYVNIDDCWSQKSRDGAGNLVPDPGKFPNGIKAVADYVHSQGLKLGIYGDAGTATCAGYPGSLGHEAQDARTFASWGVDYLKYDNCNSGSASGQTRYTAMRDALNATGRPIVYSICIWGNDSVWTWGASVGNLWRTTGDIQSNYNSMLSIYQSNVKLASYAGPGGWNDPDMLEIGNNGMSATEQQTEFSLWAEMAAPLLAGTDLRSASQQTISILGNTDVIAVDQDSLGKQGVRIASTNGLDVLAKPLANGDVAVTLFNSTGSTATISTTASAAGLGSASSYTLRDLWSKASRTTTGAISASVPAHGVVMYRVSRSGTPTPTPTTPTPTPTTPTPTPTTPTPTPTTPTPTTSGKSCTAPYRIVSSWPGGFQAEVLVTAGSSPISSWTVSWTMPSGQTINQVWNGTLTTSGQNVSVRNVAYNGSLSAGASASVGFIGSFTGNGPPATPASVSCLAG